ncbi:MAG: ABC transporter permease [Dehalococcoidia bacterium]|nr:ABC transporter permease [Dehalococcoidia bacterium]
MKLKALSANKYFMENKKKSFLVVSIFFLIVLSISFTCSLINSAFVSAENTMVKPFVTASVVMAPDGKFFLPDETVAKINSFDSVQKAVPITFETTSYTSLMGNAGALVIFTQCPLQEILDDFGLKLKEGRLPQQNEYEVVLHENILRNKGLNVGDEFGDVVDEREWVMGRYTIVGSLTNGPMLSFGTKSYAIEALEDAGVDMSMHTIGVLVFPTTNIDSLNSDLSTFGKTEARLFTYNTLQKELNEELAGIQSIIGLVLIVVVFAMSVSVGAIIMITYSDRQSEFGILFAIGYSRRNVMSLICKEVFSLSLMCTVIGYGMSLMLLSLLDMLVFSPGGKPLAVYSLFGLILTCVVPVMVFACATLPILWRFRKTDLVAVIEGR